MKWRFAGIFLLTFALLSVLWWAADVAPRYRVAVLGVAQLVSPIANGWWLDYDQPGMVDQVVFRSGDQTLPMLLQLPALSMALLPLVSLIVATPRLGWQGCLLRVGLGAILFFLIHVLIVLAYPMIMDHPNALKDTLGVFSGLVAFVVGPLGLWFALTYPALRSVWNLTPELHRPSGD